jgi:hydroxymethylbilane synthase
MSTFPASRPIRIATRASQLALWQANHIADCIRLLQPDIKVELVHISTQGDRDTAAPLWQMGGMGVFTREVQRAVLDQQADLAVHSLKDLPTQPTPGLTLAATPERAPVNDVLVLPAHVKLDPAACDSPFAALKSNAVIGTGSPRRRSQLLRWRPLFQFVEVRGNVDTRLKKLDQGECDALILAEAGLTRLGLNNRISIVLKAPWMYPAVGQGALGLECRADDMEFITLLQGLNHHATHQSVTAERTLLDTLRAGCHAPVGVATSVNEDQLTLEGMVLDQQGNIVIAARATGPLNDPQQVGKQVAEALFELGVAKLLLPSEPRT